MSRIVRSGGTALAVGALYALVAYFTSDSVREEYHGTFLICWAVHMWTICLAVAAARPRILVQLSVAVGFTWGFLAVLSAAISIQNRRVSVYWPTMLPALIAIPVAVELTALPVYFVSKWLQKRRAAKHDAAPKI